MDFLWNAPHLSGGSHSASTRGSRQCGFECLEPRQLLAADWANGVADVSFGHSGGPTGSLSGSVFESPAANCDSHAGAASLAGVRVQLLNETGAVLEESKTDAQGAYHFADLIPGEYAVQQITQHGFRERSSLEGNAVESTPSIGEGGGIAVGSNRVGEIVVHAGETLRGYNFCEHARTVDPASRVLSFLTLTIQSTQSLPVLRGMTFAESPVELFERAATAPLGPLHLPRPAEVFGGSSRSLKSAESIKPWGDFPWDSFFLRASFLELASVVQPGTAQPSADVFESIFSEPTSLDSMSRETDSMSLETDSLESLARDGYFRDNEESRDTLFSEGVEYDLLPFDAESSDLAEEATEAAGNAEMAVVPKVAARSDVKKSGSPN